MSEPATGLTDGASASPATGADAARTQSTPCAWCMPHTLQTSVSHGICPACVETMRADLEARLRRVVDRVHDADDGVNRLAGCRRYLRRVHDFLTRLRIRA